MSRGCLRTSLPSRRDTGTVCNGTRGRSRRIDLRTFSNSTRTDYGYFPRDQQGGRLQFIKSGTPADPTSLQSLEYAYDATGNVEWIKDYKAGSDPQNPQVQDFGYDALNRLTSAVVTGGINGLRPKLICNSVRLSLENTN